MCSQSPRRSSARCDRVPEATGVLDLRAVRARFERAAQTYAGASRLEAEVASRMLERLQYVKAAPRRVLDAGCGPGRDLRSLARRYPGALQVALDISPGMLRAATRRGILERLFGGASPRAVCGDIARLPLAAGSVGVVWSSMALHWVGDRAAALREFHRVLESEGLLMLSTLGPDTLRELRAAAGDGRVHPFADMHDIGDMLVAAGFAAPVMDAERLTIVYPGGEALLADLRASGQTCALAARRRGLAGRGFRRAVLERLAARRGAAGLEVTFEVVYGHAWKPAPAKTADGRAVMRFARASGAKTPR
jgi:malonyl-CoA O-methyltransferase